MAHNIPLRPHRRIPTTNAMGWSSNTLNELSEVFVGVCRPGLMALDIGAAMGVATIPALAAGATVHANDASLEQLQQLEANTPAEHRDRLRIHPGRFHRDFKFQAEAFDLAHASNVFHFFTGRQLEQSASLLQHVLKPSGRVYVLAATPYMGPFSSFIPAYEENVRNGVLWPGWIENTRQFCTHRLISNFPKSIHLLDEAVLTRVFGKAGFEIEQCWTLRRWDLPKSIHFDGRENVALIARRI
jgi:hypothetical protein